MIEIHMLDSENNEICNCIYINYFLGLKGHTSAGIVVTQFNCSFALVQWTDLTIKWQPTIALFN